MSFGAKLRAARKARGWSLVRLAVASGVQDDTIAGIERGKRNPRIATVEALAKGLGVPICALAGTSCNTGVLYARAAALEAAAYSLRIDVERIAKPPIAKGGAGR